MRWIGQGGSEDVAGVYMAFVWKTLRSVTDTHV